VKIGYPKLIYKKGVLSATRLTVRPPVGWEWEIIWLGGWTDDIGVSVNWLMSDGEYTFYRTTGSFGRDANRLYFFVGYSENTSDQQQANPNAIINSGISITLECPTIGANYLNICGHVLLRPDDVRDYYWKHEQSLRGYKWPNVPKVAII
jgi:hypothetical protein